MKDVFSTTFLLKLVVFKTLDLMKELQLCTTMVL